MKKDSWILGSMLALTMTLAAGCGSDVHLDGRSGGAGPGGNSDTQVSGSMSELVTSNKWCAEAGDGTQVIYGLKFNPDQSARLIIASAGFASEPYAQSLKWQLESDTVYLAAAGTRLPNFAFKRASEGKLRFESSIITDPTANGKLDLSSCTSSQLQATGL